MGSAPLEFSRPLFSKRPKIPRSPNRAQRVFPILGLLQPGMKNTDANFDFLTERLPARRGVPTSETHLRRARGQGSMRCLPSTLAFDSRRMLIRDGQHASSSFPGKTLVGTFAY